MTQYHPSRSEGNIVTGAESYSSFTIPIILMTAPPQHKQRDYYIFWSIATLTVVLGQIYVASSYQSLAQALRMTLL